MRPEVAIIMINYKDYADRFLSQSYASLLKNDYPKDRYRLYITDNESTPETAGTLKRLAPEAVIIPSKGNGWGHGNNLAVQKALSEGFGDFFFFVNMDTEFDPKFLSEAVNRIEQTNDIGAVQSLLLAHPQKQGRYLINSQGNKLTFLGFGYSQGEGMPDPGQGYPEEIAYASGAAMLISKQLFLDIGLCDESLFMYHDDLEISFKARLLGKRIVLAPKSIVYHKHEFSRSIRQVYYMERNRLKFLLEFYKWPTLALIAGPLAIMEGGMLFYAALNGWLGAKIKSYLWFLNSQNIGRIAVKRKFLKALRRIPDKELLGPVIARVEYQEVSNPLLDNVVNPVFEAYWKTVKKIIFW